MAGAPLVSRAVNALIADAKVSLGARMLGGGLAERTGRAMFDGLWVGGTAHLYADRLEFQPNMINRMAHAGDTSWSIPLNAITGVTVRPAAFTNIIAIEAGDAAFPIRCYGADKFAAAIRDAAGMV